MELEERDGRQEPQEQEQKEKKPLFFNPFVLICCLVVFCGLLTFIIPPGTLVEGVYEALPRNPFNFHNLFHIIRAIPYGMKDSSGIVMLILISGGALEIFKRTGAIDNGIAQLAAKLGEGPKTILLAAMIVVFSVIGGFLGWMEAFIPFVPLTVAVVLALGYDGLTAIAICTVGIMGGFISGPANPYTVAVCNGILRNMDMLPEGSGVFYGFGFRMVVWVIITVVGTAYTMLYATRTYAHPELSYIKDIDVSDLRLDISGAEDKKLTRPQMFVLLTILAGLILAAVGIQYGFSGIKWDIDDVSSVFFIVGIASGFIMKMKPDEISGAFISGAKLSVGGALVVGAARGVYWILETANINATILYGMTSLLRGLSPLPAAIGIIIIVSFFNAIIPSGSAKAALLGPVMLPIAISLGLPPQTAVLAYQFGDGITNMFWLTHGTLLIFLNYGKVPINKWYKFFMPIMAVYFLIAFVSVGVAAHIGF